MELRCADLGLQCSTKVTGDSEEELVGNLRRHAADDHDVPVLNETLIDYAVSQARAGGKGR